MGFTENMKWGYECALSRSARSEWIEISHYRTQREVPQSLAPHGASGLKSIFMKNSLRDLMSRSARSEWIEILDAMQH